VKTWDLGQFHRTGYLEKDLVDYNISNIKANTSLHYKITNKIEAKLAIILAMEQLYIKAITVIV
jgi:hypothetical protein